MLLVAEQAAEPERGVGGGGRPKKFIQVHRSHFFETRNTFLESSELETHATSSAVNYDLLISLTLSVGVSSSSCGSRSA